MQVTQHSLNTDVAYVQDITIYFLTQWITRVNVTNTNLYFVVSKTSEFIEVTLFTVQHYNK